MTRPPPHEDNGRTRRRRPPWRGALLLGACGVAVATADAPEAGSVHLGAGTYYTAPRHGATGIDLVPPPAPFRGGAAARAAAPTNQWDSSVMFQRWSRPLYALPMSYAAGPAGFEIGLPARELAVLDGGGRKEMRYLHVPAIVVAPLAFAPRDARLTRHADWLAEITLAAGAGESLRATVLHGSPFSYFECSRGDVRLTLAAAPALLWDPADPARDPRALAFAVAGRAYAAFAPHGARWERAGATEFVLRLPQGARYFSVAGLPDGREATVRDFLARAYAFPTDTRVSWAYDERASTVTETFAVTTLAREGENLTTFMGLYPHHWSAAAPPPAALYQYESVRGPIRLVAANRFVVRRRYHGFVPYWGGLEDAADRDALGRLLAADAARLGGPAAPGAAGTYWTGKELNARVQLAGIAEAEGELAARDALLAAVRARLESWFDGRHAGYFVEDARLGTFVGIPQEYNSIQNMNDHHFHYGYWLGAAAHLALRDRDWLGAARYGGMVGKLVADIATAERGRADFPFLRNFDVYEGHSWASGTANLVAGNNQESSSEAVNAWASLVLLGEATGDRRLRDLGIYLYTSEIASVQQYWFDLDHQVIRPEFGEPFASMVFGGKYAYNTWWTEEPRQIAGINVLPLTPAATYLGADPAAVRRIIAALPAKQQAYYARGHTDGTPPDIWQDLLAGFLALADPAAGRAAWNPDGHVEFGETRAHTFFWLASLAATGAPDLSVAADTPLFAVFGDARRGRSYLAYNARDAALTVHFSDGKVLMVPPHALARSR
ncbi:MAG TPA: glycosyl hydrolase [Steroidobacteraceae bacterium]|nr:glycosyl hydrolase [Steroidobacteraceae bacterium]